MSDPVKLTEQRLFEAVRDGAHLAFTDAMEPVFQSNRSMTEIVMGAVSSGVQEAFWNAIRNATTMPTADTFDSIQAGVKEAFAAALAESRQWDKIFGPPDPDLRKGAIAVLACREIRESIDRIGRRGKAATADGWALVREEMTDEEMAAIFDAALRGAGQ